MRTRNALESALLVAGLVGVLSACESDCARRVVDGYGPGAPGPHASGARPRAASDQGVDLGGIDCSDGVLRCRQGNVEASRAAHVASSCKGREGEGTSGCVCPWDLVARCPSGCAAEDLEVLGDDVDAGAEQLCHRVAAVARPVGLSETVGADVCTAPAIACRDGIVRVCAASGDPSRPVAVCANGCDVRFAIDEPGAIPGTDLSAGIQGGPTVPLDGVVSILCRHDHAERR